MNVEAQIAKSTILQEWNPQRWRARSIEDTVRPNWFPESHGFWASRASHLEVIERAILDDLDYLMVIEDDFNVQPDDGGSIRPSFDETFRYVWSILPEDWMGVQFGGYHVSPPSQIKPGLVRLWRFFECPLALYSRSGIRKVFDTGCEKPDHVFDWMLMELYHTEPRFFAPEMLPVGQIQSWSDNENRINHET